ncbi:10 TM acyl transferase domain found in Cas1p-domain-containing protein [Mucor mucedo]|uniref:10 TM acyl transferase domain found in Cas1p-domain-containing protein n=1 Tax=Mucor mucedo TaxID=29922 RepID=UPI00221ED62B|nr:10 TM acyl transferase domain found in Cas1p-domain-containing protein [Mucor mucedo]KAI7886893.1 10 TM acyl transferase domain found in Cas1p-domain-containing protein [Mucor mucedo]
MMHSYKATDMSTCLSHSRVVYVGDSLVRQQFFAALQLVRPNVDTSGESHVHRKYVFNEEKLTMEFWWDPYLNTTEILKGTSPALKPSLLVVGTGAWQMHYLGKNYFEHFQSSMDSLFETVSTHSIADAMLVSPVEIPQYDKLSPARRASMTIEKIKKMNDYLRHKQGEYVDPKTRMGIPFIWNEIGAHLSNVTDDGLHFKQTVTSLQAQIALNYRCNDELDKKFPMGTTCCFTYPRPRWYQNILILLFLIWVPTGFFVSTATTSGSLTRKLFPGTKLLNALFIFGLCVMYMYLGDRTQLFGKIHKNFNPTIFTGLMIGTAVLGMAKLSHKKEGDGGFLNRHQTDEWKGWMQVIILVYHFCGASGTSGIYNAVRILVAAYLFQTGYGHFFFFYKKADFGMTRVLNVMVRLNFLTFVLQYLMDTDYLSYYFTPLVSFWFLAIWIIMYVGHTWNKHPGFMLCKLLIACVLTTLFIKVPGILEFLFSVLQTCFNVQWNAAEWRFRLALDAYIVYIGMLCAYAYIKISEHKLTDHPKWSSVKLAAIFCSAIATVWYFWFELTRKDKYVYNDSHPYISFIPILAFIVLRNSSLYLRNTHSEFFAFIGKISLETFIGQFHMWLAGDTKGLLVLFMRSSWVQGLGWWINLCLSSCLFIFVCYYMSQSTQEISSWLCKTMLHKYTLTPASSSATGEYQAVPLLPTTTSLVEGVDRPKNEEGEEEIWDASLTEKKPHMVTRFFDDTRVKSLLFLLLVGLVNNLC